MNEPRVLILDHSTMQSRIIPLAQFCEENGSDADLCAEVRDLAVTRGITIGGGAAPAFSITRWS